VRLGGDARMQRETADLAGVASGASASAGIVCSVVTLRPACFPVAMR